MHKQKKKKGEMEKKKGETLGKESRFTKWKCNDKDMESDKNRKRN